MGRRRKKYKRPVRKPRRIPSFFQCPNCGRRTLQIKFEKMDQMGFKLAIIRCGSCGLYAEMQVPELYQQVDVYAKFLDLYEEGQIHVEFRKIEEEAGETSIGEA